MFLPRIALHRAARAPSRQLTRGPPDRVEQKGPGPAGGVHDSLVEGTVDDRLHHTRGEPIRACSTPQFVPGLGVDEALVKGLQDIDPNISESESGYLVRDPHDEVRALFDLSTQSKKSRFALARRSRGSVNAVPWRRSAAASGGASIIAVQATAFATTTR